MRNTLYIALVLLAGTAQAQDPSMHDYCIATTEEKEIADATALIIPSSQVHLNSDGTYSIDSTTLTIANGDPQAPICQDEPLFDQRYAYWGRTAFLVGADLMVTVPHGPQSIYDPKDYTVVFGLRREMTSKGECGAADFAQIPAANVYFPPVDSYTYTSYALAANIPADYLLFKLDRAVPGVKPLALRRSGKPEIGDPLLIVGHPGRLALKMAAGASVDAISADGIDIGYTSNWNGSSGSPVFNLRKKVVETAVARATSGTAWVEDTRSGCWRIGPSQDAELHHGINNGPLSLFASHVPAPPLEIQMSPEDPVLHLPVANGTLTNATTTFFVAPSPNAAGSPPQTFHVASPAFSEGLQSATLIITPPGDFTVSSSDSPSKFTVSAVATGMSCGTYTTEVKVIRADGDVVGVIPHRFEFGMSDFIAAPDTSWTISELSAAWPTRQVQLTNTGSIATTLSVTSTRPWITVNGNASASIVLAPVGSNGSTATVSLAIGSNVGSYVGIGLTGTATVDIVPTNATCSLRPGLSIPVSFTHGVERFTGISPAFAALSQPQSGQTFGAVLEIPINLAAEPAFSVADVNLNVGFYNENGSGYVGADVADSLIKAVLVAPDGTSALLWDRQNAPANYIEQSTVIADSAATPASILKLADESTLPLGPHALSTFNGRMGNGVWKLQLYGAAGSGSVLPLSAELVMTKAGSTSPILFTGYPPTFDVLPAPASGQTFGAAVEIPFNLTAQTAFTVADLNLAVGFYNENGSGFVGAEMADSVVKLELIAPDNTSAVVWNRNNTTPSYVSASNVYLDGATTPVSLLMLDDSGTPPLGPNMLSTFNGHAGQGTWKLRIYGDSGGHVVVPLVARIAVSRTP